MPLALPDLQRAFAEHLGGSERADLVALVTSDAIPAASRLDVYRHHVRHSLAAALATTFSTVQAVVGEGFFRGLAQAFVEQALPVQPVLSEYGAGLPDFIAGYEPAGGLPYLADVARLDWALNAACHACPVKGLGASDLAAIDIGRLPSLSLSLTPGTALVASRFPLGGIWLASQPGADAASVDLGSGGAHLLVMRRPDDAVFVELSSAEAVFVTALIDGRPIEGAAEAALHADSAFDLSAVFSRLLGFKIIAAVQ